MAHLRGSFFVVGILVVGCPLASCVDPGAGAAGQPVQRMEGDMGEVRGFVAEPLEIQIDGASVRIDAVSTVPAWWVMTRLTFTPAVTDSQWLGATVDSALDGSASQPTSLRVSAIGCSGPTRGHYTFDAAPQHIVVHVEPGATASTRHVTFTEYYDSTAGASAVTGSFEYGLQ